MNLNSKKALNIVLTIVTYGLVLTITSLVFKDNFYLDLSSYGIWVLLVTIIVFILNKTIKPILSWLAIPLTAVTLGLFSFVIDLGILKLADLIVGPHFEIGNFFIALLAALFISILNAIMENVLIEPLKKGE